MRRGFFYILLFIAMSALWACNQSSERQPLSLDELSEWVKPEYAIDGQRILDQIHQQADATPVRMYADAYTRAYYADDSHPLVWITRMGIDPCADVLMQYLSAADTLGISKEAFQLDTLQALVRRMHQLDFNGITVNEVLSQLEYRLTFAYLRYACGQRFGFMHARKVFDHLLLDPPAPGETRNISVYRRLFDHEADEVTDSFVHHALEEVRNHRIQAFLEEVQPKSKIYQQMSREYQRAKQQGDTTRAKLAYINMERARWRYPHPTKGKYIFVNLAAQELMAVDTERDSVMTMRVCCGNSTHKTPLLHSEIRTIELNPYWVIPQTIVRKEIMPSHVGDSAYFTRNNYRAINKETKEEVDPTTLTAADLRSARFTLRQERGRGNSLGRIIFRFANNFSVFLHDTNNHGAFQYANRAISHGCIRVERPLDLLVFTLDNPSAWYLDRIRISIDQTPLTAEGRQYKAAHPGSKPISSIGLPQPIPVWLDYWTLYPTLRGSFRSYEDKYGYDKVIEEGLKKIKEL